MLIHNPVQPLSVCVDCEAEEFDPSELTWALVTLTAVTLCYLAVCFCRCYPKLKSLWIDGPIPNSRARTLSQRAIIKLQPGQVQIINPRMVPGTAHLDCGVRAVPGYPNRRRSSLGSSRYHNRRLSSHKIDVGSPVKNRPVDIPQGTPSRCQSIHGQVPKNNVQIVDPRPTPTHMAHTPKRCSQDVVVKSGHQCTPVMKRVVFDYPVDRNGRLIPYPSGLSKPEVFSIKIPIKCANEMLGKEPKNGFNRSGSRSSGNGEASDPCNHNHDDGNGTNINVKMSSPYS